MNTIPRCSYRALLLCALLLVSQTIVMTSTPEKSCEALRRWAYQYENTHPTLDDLGQFDRGHRLAIFNAIGPDARAALWREQLRRFSQRPGLTATQRTLIGEAIALTTPAVYAGDRRAAEAVTAVWTRAQSAFNRDDRAYWLVLGAGLTGPSIAATAENEDWCECNNGYGWLECEETGLCPGGGCDEWLGCGPNGGHSCNGKCIR